jgi:hypothetical protein
LQIERRRGALQIAGNNARVELRSVGQGENGVNIKGGGLDLLLEQIGGPLGVELRASQLLADGLKGRVDLKALEGTDLSLQNATGGLKLNLGGGASARLSEVRHGLTVEMRDSDLDLQQIARLSLVARASQINAREVRRVEKMEVMDCELDLSLANTNHSPTLQLKGASRASVELPAPCSVKVLGQGMVSGAEVRASGCGIETQGHGRRRYQNRGLDGGRAVVLTVRIAEDSSLEVEGRP